MLLEVLWPGIQLKDSVVYYYVVHLLDVQVDVVVVVMMCFRVLLLLLVVLILL